MNIAFLERSITASETTTAEPHRQLAEANLIEFTMPDPLSEDPMDVVASSIFRSTTDINDFSIRYRKKYHHSRSRSLTLLKRHPDSDPTVAYDHVLSGIKAHVQRVYLSRRLDQVEGAMEEAMKQLRDIDVLVVYVI